MNLSDLAAMLGCELRGDGSIEITGVAGMEHAGATEVTFLANPKYAPKVKQSGAGAVLVKAYIEDIAPAQLLSKNPYLDFARALELFYQPPRPAPGIHPLAYVAETARIGENASIGPFVAVGENVILGRDAVLHPHVVIYEGAQIGDQFLAHSHAVVREYCRVGDRVILQNNAVVGGDGFGFAKRADGTHYKIVQSGVAVIEDDVEIQTLTSIDRASTGETRVQRGAKIDSLVQVGHGCVVGEDNIICSQTGLAGSSVLGKNVLLAGQVGISGHLTIHDDAVIYAQSGIGGDVEAGAVMSGSPAFEAREWLRAITAFPKLPVLLRTMRQLEKRVAELEASSLTNPMHERQDRSALAYRNQQFLDAPDARSLRILSEYLYPLSHFRQQKIHDTIVFFGSARTLEMGPLGRYYNEARALAKRITQWSDSLHESGRRFVVCSGGGPGIMEAANRGAQDAGGKTIGLNIGLPFEQRPNPFITPELNFEFHYFFMRKFWFAYLAKALVVFPGGFGTLDELTEILTLAQTQKLEKKMTVILYGTTFWKEIINFDALVRHGMIAEKDLDLFSFADDVETAFSLLEAGLTKHYIEPDTQVPEIAKSRV